MLYQETVKITGVALLAILVSGILYRLAGKWISRSKGKGFGEDRYQLSVRNQSVTRECKMYSSVGDLIGRSINSNNNNNNNNNDDDNNNNNNHVFIHVIKLHVKS